MTSNMSNGPRPARGRYKDYCGRGCYVGIAREASPGKDGYVRVIYDDGNFTCAFFRTFAHWGFTLVEDYDAE